jgi:hypothetical protein
VDDIQVELSDTENTVVIDTAEGEALYTANETRQLAYYIQAESRNRWDVDCEELIAYLKDLADAIDGEKAVDEVTEIWNHRDIDTTLI